jgi:hypothetical protein
MSREEFSQNFMKATLRLHTLALMAVENELKQPFSFLVKLNQSYDGNPLAKGKVIPREMRARGGTSVGPLSHEAVVSLLWRDGLVPEWIDITPWQATADGLTFQLLCCGRFATGEPHLYHNKDGYPPFHAPGVLIPIDWESVEESGRLDVNWHLKRKSKGEFIGDAKAVTSHLQSFRLRL